MLTDPQDPKFPESPGEPNSEVKPELPNEENAQPANESPASPAESGDYISEIRQTLASEETGQSKSRTGRLIRRITGSLRWVTGSLHSPDQRKQEEEENASEPNQPVISGKTPTGRLDSEPEPEISNELLTGRLGNEPGQAVPGEVPTGRLGSATAPAQETDGDSLLTGRLPGERTQEMPDDLLTGRLATAPTPETGNLLTGRLGKAPAEETSDNLLTGRLRQAPETEVPDNLITGRLGSEPKPKVPGELVTRSLDIAEEPEAKPSGDLLTGRLGQVPEKEISDDLLTGKLGSEPQQKAPGNLVTRTLDEEPEAEAPDNLLTGRLGQAPEKEIPDNLLTGRLAQAPETSTTDDLLTGKLSGKPKQETPGSLVTRRLDMEEKAEIPDNLLTGRLGQAPETENHDDLVTGRLSSEPEPKGPGNLVTRSLDEQPEVEAPDNLLTGRLGKATEKEISDDLLTGRLGQAPETQSSDDLITGKLGKETKQEVPNNLVTSRLDIEEEQKIPDSLLTGRLGKVTEQEVPDNLVTSRLDIEEEPEIPDSLITGKPGQTPETEIPDDFITGRLSSEPKPERPGNWVTRSLDNEPEPEIPDDLLAGRLGQAPEPEMPDNFLAGRLGGMVEAESQPIPQPENWGDLPDSGSEAAELLEMEEEPLPGAKVEPETVLGDDEPITLLESGAIAAMGMAEEEASLGDEEWMSEIREEAAHEAEQGAEQDALLTGEAGAEIWSDQPPTEQPTPRNVTSPLRNFFTGIFGKPGERGKQAEEFEIPDEMVTGRLERSLGAEGKETPAMDMGDEGFFAPPTAPELEGAAGENGLDNPITVAFGETPTIDETSILESPVIQGKEDFFEGLEVNFSNVAEAGDSIGGYDLYPEDEALLWGNTTQQTTEPAAPEIPISPEDIWGSETGGPSFGSDLRREIWGEAAEPETNAPDLFAHDETIKPNTGDLYAATYLTGEDFLPSIEKEEKIEPDQEELLGSILSQQPEGDEGASVQDLRAIALEDYEEGELDYSNYTYKIDWGDEQGATVQEWKGSKAEIEQMQLQEQEAEAETRQALSTDWKSWFANRKTSHKILLVEAAIVAIALLVAVPYFLILIFRGPAIPIADGQPNAGVTNIPYPTGLTLPGGWYFPLETSRLNHGVWQPKTSEWLEGSEVRRVVALPWNPQTEAVVKTFQVGDGVALYLSNNETLKYRVFSIEQVAISSTEIYSDSNPSLAIILYQGKDATRWVIICKP